MSQNQEDKRVKMNITLPPETKTALEMLSKERRCSKSEVINQLVQEVEQKKGNENT